MLRLDCCKITVGCSLFMHMLLWFYVAGFIPFSDQHGAERNHQGASCCSCVNPSPLLCHYQTYIKEDFAEIYWEVVKRVLLI